ncbi:MAG: DUF4097 domain-containing protein [Caldilineales bacterium]|nr:DUF4097 domain-containing protein [Caldilineales bacterium]
MQPSQPSPPLWIVLAAAALLCVAAAAAALVGVAGLRLLAGGGDGRASLFNRFDVGVALATRAVEERFTTGPAARVAVDLTVGSVEVTAGETDAVAVEARILAYGVTQRDAEEALRSVTFEAIQDGSTVTVRGGWPPQARWRGRSPSIEVRIVLPPNTSLDVAVDVGEVRIAGVQAEVAVEADVGRVELTDVRPTQALRVRTNVAEIHWRGPLAAGASYTLTSNVGAIRMALPADSTFTVDASSNVGRVEIAFPLEGEVGAAPVGGAVRGAVGSAPTATLTLRSDIGAITVRPE